MLLTSAYKKYNCPTDLAEGWLEMIGASECLYRAPVTCSDCSDLYESNSVVTGM